MTVTSNIAATAPSASAAIQFRPQDVGTNASRASATNYQDLWWNAAESGWGINIAHQDTTLPAPYQPATSSGESQVRAH